MESGLAPYLAAMKTWGWTTIANFAFSSSYMPGSPDDSPFQTGVVDPILGDRSSPHVAALRRLLFDCFTMAAADTRRKVESTDDDAPRAMPTVEREGR